MKQRRNRIFEEPSSQLYSSSIQREDFVKDHQIKQKPPNIMTTLIFVLLYLVVSVAGQNRTQSFSSLVWTQDEGNQTFELGEATGLSGFEMNAWMLPYRESDDPIIIPIMRFLNQITLRYQLYRDPQNVLQNAIGFVYNGFTYNQSFPLFNPYKWMNVNLRVQFRSYVTLSIWYDLYNVNPQPDITLSHPNPVDFTSITFELLKMNDTMYFRMAELRVFELDIARSFGQYFKYYHGIWPASLANNFDKQRQYLTSYNDILYMDIKNTSKNISNLNPLDSPIERCLYGQMITVKGPAPTGQTLPTQIMMTQYQCNFCSNLDCMICPANYKGVCKFCKKGSTICKDDNTVDECPTDYFLKNGICQRCPPGCSNCTSERQCGGCDPGLELFSNLTAKICKCSQGYFGTNDFINDKLTCSPCDTSKCMTCEGSAVQCTSCTPASNLFLYDTTCVANCKTQTVPSFTSVDDRKCVACGENCLDCVNATFCNQMKCKWEASPGIKSFNHQGICKTMCPPNALPNSVTQNCDNCGFKCAECQTYTTNCKVCELGYFLEKTNETHSTCMSKCPAGKYPDGSNTCQDCPKQCLLCEAASQCTLCRKVEPGPTGNKELYYYVNFKCEKQCPDRYYKDSKDMNDLFCRSCPSGCNQCTDENTCTVCDNGWYMDSFKLENFPNGTAQIQNLCVNQCQPGYFPSNDTDYWKCRSCLPNCEKCDNTTFCSKCTKGYVLYINTGTSPATYSCIEQCPDGFYANAENECKKCINNCKTCYNNYTCDLCNTGSFKVEDTQFCNTGSCPSGYYLQTPTCTRCKKECLTCSFGTNCDSCVIGYSFAAGGKCNTKCGDGKRDDNEECDDGNFEDDDGCASECTVEDQFVCMPLDTTTMGPDVCFCNAKPLSASWTEYWGTILIKFGSQIVYNTENGPKSSDAQIFCSQILDPTMFDNKNLGTEFNCFLDASGTESTIRINVDLDAKIGNNDQQYQTKVKFINGALKVKGCPKSIPLTYPVTNLPLDSPIVYFQSSLNGLVVPKCASYYGLNIFTSKGFTKRNVDVVWNLTSMNPDDSELKQELQDYIEKKYTGVKYFEFTADQIERLAGKSLGVRVTVTNFLGLNGFNTTTIQFANSKSLILVDLQDIYTFQTAVYNTLAPRVRIPYCSGEANNLQEKELQDVQLQCTLYSSDMLKKTPMTNCTIPINNMTLGNPYKVKVSAINLKDPNMGVTKWVHIDTASPNARIAYINGCDRLFSVNNSFDLEVMTPNNVSFSNFNWYCTDLATGSPCFTTSFSYITMANTKKVTIQGGQLFANNTYQFKVLLYDQLSQTEESKSCLMYAAPIENQVLDIVIDTEANKNGFIDFNAQMAAFKIQTVGLQNINRQALNFTWRFTDSSGTVFQNKDLSIYQNSLGVLISKLERSNVYQVETNATYGQIKGYIKTTYDTEPKMSFQFSVEPPEGEPHKTVFTFSVSSQDTIEGLYQYVFGYVSPLDKISQIPIYQKSTNRYQRTQLPLPDGQNYLTCYVQVMLPSGESKTYQQNVTMTFPSLTVQEFKQQLSVVVMDDLVESMQMLNKLVTLRSKMTLADRSFAIRQILKGLQKENTPLSDYNIQSSVASMLEYISKEQESLLSDSQIVTISAALFKQITIDENLDILNGRYSQFGRAATFSLYNFANNLFQKDFTNVIGGPEQLRMKIMFMQGLKNILKGSLSNQILGDIGGFSYQGQNIYVKAVKFDQLESNYLINASMPISLNTKLTRNYVNISLPNSMSDSNPCKGKLACQASIIILDNPVNAFLSNQKDSRLMSMFVDLSIQETEVSSPNSYVSIKELAVKELKDPIQLTIPLLIEFTDTSKNRTLGCGYLDETDQIFKADGIKAVMLSTKLITCQANHLTAIGVEEFAVERQAGATDDPSVVTTSNQTTSTTAKGAGEQINMWQSWAVFTSFGLLAALGAGGVWGYQRDKRDELNLRKVYLNKERIYINLFLDPLAEEQLAALEQQDNEDDYEEIQQERARQLELKRKRQDDIFNKNQAASKYVNENMPVMGLFSPEEIEEKMKYIRPSTGAPPEAQGHMQEAMKNVLADAKEKKKKKSSKKKSKKNAATDLLFEGGSSDENGDLPEYIEQYEGGSGDEAGEMDEAAETVRPKGKKKKKKSSTKKQDTFLSKGATTFEKFEESVKNHSPDRSPSPQKPQADTLMVVDDLDNEEVKTIQTKKSRKSSSKSPTKKKKTLKKRIDEAPDQEIVINNVNLAGFGQQNNNPVVVSPTNAADQSVLVEESKSKKSMKGKKSKRGSRSSSAQRQRSKSGDDEDGAGPAEEKPDFEAEVVERKPRGGEAPSRVQKEDLFKPISQIEREKKAAEYEARDEKSTKTKKKGKKAKKGKKKTKKNKNEDEDDFDDDESEESSDAEDTDEEERIKKQKAERDQDEEPAGCCQFCFWNFREGHRCLSFFSFYNDKLSRPTRWAILVMSWYLFMAFTGLFMGGAQIIAGKENRLEQLVIGAITAFAMRFWVLIVTYLMMHPKENKVHEMITNKIKANRAIRTNNAKFYLGLLIIAITIIFGAAEGFSLSGKYTITMVDNWGWAFLFAIIADFILIDALFMSVVTIITVKVGATPDACGMKRAFWLSLIPPAIKDSIE